MNKSNAKSVKLQIENARIAAFDATKSFITGLHEVAEESAELSRLENLPQGVRAALSRLDQMVRNEMNNINDIITRVTPNAHAKRNVYLLPSEPHRELTDDSSRHS